MLPREFRIMVSAERGYDMFRFVSQDVEEEGDMCTFSVSTKLAFHWIEEKEAWWPVL
jgi:hypothetical protein